MNIKDFKVGQRAYILDMHEGRNEEPTIRKTTVIKVGRKYVTVRNDKTYKSTDDAYSLSESRNWGDQTYLCPSEKYAKLYIERSRLRRWLYSAAQYGDDYSLAQLRKVKDILDPDKGE